MALTNTTSGQYGKLTATGAAFVGMTEWTLNETVDVLDATDADRVAENGIRNTDTDAGFVDAELTATLLCKGSVSIKPGDVVTSVSIYNYKPATSPDAAVRSYAQMVCTRLNWSARIRGQRQLNLTFKPQQAAS